jgi:DNA-binding NarL/FixJ family response regulator
MLSNVLIVDDHTIVREGVKRILWENDKFFTIEEAGSGAEAIKKILEKHFDLIILDIGLPGRDGIEILKEIKTLRPRVYVLILSIHSEQQYGVRALKAGADGYVSKESAAKDLVRAVQTVLSGKKYIGPSLAEKIAFDLANKTGEVLHERLSDREYQVMCKIAAGKTVAEIAEELALSKQSISTYRVRALQKMNMKNNSELMYYAIKNGLI